MKLEIEKIDNNFFVKCDVFMCVKCDFFANKKFDRCPNCRSYKIKKDTLKIKATNFVDLPF